MRRFSALLMVAGLAACGGGADKYADADTEGMPAAIDLADIAGTWNLTAMPSMGEVTTIAYTVTATDDIYGWMIQFPEREPMELRITAVDGDSIIGEVGPYESLLREGLMVSTRSVMRLEDGMLMGTFVAMYDTEPMETMAGTFEGTRAMP